MDKDLVLSVIQQNNRHATDAAALAAMKDSLPLRESPRVGDGGVEVYLRSLQVVGGILFGIVRDEREKAFFAHGANAQDLPFDGEVANKDPWLFLAPLTLENAGALQDLFPFTRPVSLRQRPATMGMGDRLGIATAGHIRAARSFQVAPVFAQQSVRENEFTGRTFRGVVADAAWLVFQEGFEDGYGADGDHLKNLEKIDVALEAGMPMVTLDLTEVMRPEPVDWDETDVEDAFDMLPEADRERLLTNYADVSCDLGGGVTITMSALEVKRCTLMYGPALDFSKVVNDHIRTVRGDAYDLEISIDETTTPTLPEHHLFIARELVYRGVEVNSLAPRFIGEFEKGVDYIGDVAEFERQFTVHCLIAKANGHYKISVHSGSDKFTVYPVVGRETGGRLHLKTAGTTWLEALNTLAVYDPDLYRRIHREALETHSEALSHYVISSDFSKIPPLDEVTDVDLPSYLINTNSRQMLHISYGGILKNTALREELYRALHRLEEEHYRMVASHLAKHIELLGLPRVD